MKRLLLVAFLFSCAVPAFAQDGRWYRLSGKSVMEIKTARPEKVAHFQLLQRQPAGKKRGASPTLLRKANLQAAWKYEDLAFFCKIEVRLEEFADFPIKFRIGEVQEVEKLEGKY